MTVNLTRRRTVVGAVLVSTLGLPLLAVAALAAPGPAVAPPPLRVSLSQPDAGSVAAVEKAAGPDTIAGTYLDAAGRVHADVTSITAAERVRAAGGVSKVVSHSTADLRRATQTLDASARVPGTAWVVDPTTNQVSVMIDSTVTATEQARVTSAVAKLGSAARLTRLPGRLTRLMSGADAITGGGGRCSAGFNVQWHDAQGAIKKGMMTAGHCTATVTDWYTQMSQQHFATTRLYDYPKPGNAGADWGLARYDVGTTVAHPGDVNLYNGKHQDITKVATPVAGQYAARAGSTTGFHDGKVLGLNATATYTDGVTVTNMILTNICAEPGDSGGPLFSGPAAFGLTSGGIGNCSAAGLTYYQPLATALSELNKRAIDAKVY